jgi:hypothetical protein
MRMCLVCFASLLLVGAGACTLFDQAPVIGSPGTVPATAEGSYQVTTTYDLASIPPAASTAIAQLVLDPGDPDAPARFLVDQMLAALPASEVNSIASDAEPVLVALVEAGLDVFAPRFVAGFAQLATGLGALAYRFTIVERWDIGLGYQGERTLLGLELDGGSGASEVSFASLGVAESIAPMAVALAADGTLSIAPQTQPLAYGAMLAAGFDLAVVPSVVAGTYDLGDALVELVDCEGLAQTIASAVTGPASWYSDACRVALSTVATSFYDELCAIDDLPLTIVASGSALGVATSGDHTLDLIENGLWTGVIAQDAQSEPLGAATFSGSR